MVKNVYIVFSLLCLVCPLCLTGTPIDTQQAIDVGGIKQWISIKGINKDDPVLLFLHGGPGNSAMSYAQKFTNELQKHFIVVQWDQRESGKTAKLTTSLQPLNVSLMENDAVEVVNYLRSRFSQNKIYLMGHSWGGFLGLRLAANHPELLAAYFAVSPMVHQDESERLSLEWMKDMARAKKDEKASLELATIHVPFSTGDDLYYHRKWLAINMGAKPVAKSFVEIWSAKWFLLFQEASHVNFFADAPEIKCPIYFFVGSRDHQTDSHLTEDYYKMIKAEKKDLFWFTDSAHTLTLTESAKFQKVVISILKFKH